MKSLSRKSRSRFYILFNNVLPVNEMSIVRLDGNGKHSHSIHKHDVIMSWRYWYWCLKPTATHRRYIKINTDNLRGGNALVWCPTTLSLAPSFKFQRFFVPRRVIALPVFTLFLMAAEQLVANWRTFH